MYVAYTEDKLYKDIGIVSWYSLASGSGFHHVSTPVKPCQSRTLPPVAYWLHLHQASADDGLPWGDTEPAYQLQSAGGGLEYLPRPPPLRAGTPAAARNEPASPRS